MNVLLDLDGTLTDPGDGFVACVTHALTRLECPAYAPAEIRKLMDFEALAAAETVMVGDRAQDVVGARANGVFPVGALWGYGSREELANAGAAMLFEHPSLVPAALMVRL